MKPKDFSRNLKAAVSLLESLGNNSAASEIAMLARMFEKLDASSVAAIIKKCSTSINKEYDTGDNTASDLAAVVRSLAKFISHSGKKTFADDLSRLAAWISQHESMSTAKFVQLAEAAFLAEPKKKKKAKTVKAASPETVDMYLQRLDETYGFTDDFDEVYNQLKADDTMKVAQLKKLAKLFTKAAAKSRLEALNVIYRKHSNIVEADLHKAARGGRVS